MVALRVLWTVLVPMTIQAVGIPEPAALRPCGGTAEYRRLDFWIGEWDVLPAGAPPPAQKPSRSRIERVEDQCVIAEFYETPAGYSGRSLNSYHPDLKHWEQFWVDNTGEIHHYVGHFRDGNLYYEADGIRSAGPTSPLAKVKMTFFNQGPNQVRQLGEQSTDGGKTWTTAYDLIYRRRPEAGAGTCSAAAAEAAAGVRAVAVGLVAADNDRALDRVLDWYAADAVLLPPNEPPVQGLQSIRPRYASLFARFDPAIETHIDEVCVNGGLGFVRGRNGGRLRSRDGQPDRILSDSYLMELARDPSGKWRIGHLMWHADRQP